MTLRTGIAYVGDARELLPFVRRESVRLLLTDPPYEVSRPNNLATMGRRGVDFGAWDRGFSHTDWLEAAVATLVPGGSAVIWEDWKKLGLVAAELTRLGLDVKRNLIWRKTNPMPRNLERSFVQATETGLWAVKPGAKWVFHRRASCPFETGIFEHASPRGPNRHPTAKPLALFAELVEILTGPGDVVLDPFAGGGTAALACLALGRRFLCFDRDATYLLDGPFPLVAARLKRTWPPEAPCLTRSRPSSTRSRSSRPIGCIATR